MTYDPKAVDELLDALTSVGTIWFDKCEPEKAAKIANLVNTLRPAKKYHVMPTFEEAAKMAGSAIHNGADEERFFSSGRGAFGYIWEWNYNYLRDLTATKHPPCNPFCKIPAGKDWSDDDLKNIRFIYADAPTAENGLRAVIDAIKEKYGV